MWLRLCWIEFQFSSLPSYDRIYISVFPNYRCRIMIKKLFILACVFLLFVGLGSSAFYVMEDGEKKKVVPSEQAQENTAQQSTVAKKTSSDSFVEIAGDTLEGSLNMNGFGLTGLPSPDDSSDAVNKEYVDTRLSSSSDFSLENYATKSFVLDLFENSSGTDLDGYATEKYVDQKVSDIDGSNSSEETSPRQDLEGIDVNESKIVIGQDNETDLNVSGDLNVEGSIGGLNSSTSSKKNVWSYSFATDPNGTEVNLPSELESEYTVSVTSVNSLADTGVFNKTDKAFKVVSSKFTRVDVQVVRSSE